MPQKGGITSSRIDVSGIEIEWDASCGTCTFGSLPVAMMWVDTTLAGLMSGVQAMVGTERFGLALQSEGRRSVEADWRVISSYDDFRDGFKAIANIAAVAGWGEWSILSLDASAKECRVQVRSSWEGRYQKALGQCWGSAMLAGKMAGYCSKLFSVDCWADQTRFIAKGDECDEFQVRPSSRSIEREIERLLASDEATRADMAVALQRLESEVRQRRLAEEALRESESRYRALFEASHDAIFLLDEGRFVDCNPAALALLNNIPREQVIGRSPVDFTVPGAHEPQSAEEVAKGHNEAALNGTPQLFEWPVLRPSGDEFTLEINLTRVEIGGKALVLAVCRDVTERKMAEQALRASEEKYRAIFDESVATIYVFDQEKRFIDTNQAGLDLLGYTRDELLQMRIPDVDADPVVVLPTHGQLLGGDRIVNYEHCLRRKDGTIITVLNNSRPLKNADGKVIGMLSTLIEVTDRKRAEQELQESASRYRSLLDNLPQIIWQKDRDGTYENCNLAYASSFDRTPEQIAGKTDYDLYAAELAEKYRADDQRIFTSGLTESFDERWMKGAEERIIHTTKVPLRDLEGRIFGTLGIADDITERTRTEQALREREEIMSAIVAQAGDAIELADMETFRFVEFNDAAHALLGYTREEYAHLTVFDIQQELSEQRVQAIAAGLPRGETVQFENKHRRKNGSLINCQISLRAIELRGHRYVVSVWRDITEQKHDAEELARYRQHLEQAVEERTSKLKIANQQLLDTHFAMDHAGIGIHWVDADTGRILYVNNHAARMLGYSIEEMLELGIPDVDPNFPSGDFRTITKSLFASGSAHFESQQRKKDGTLIPVDIIGHLRPAEDGQPRRFITFISDITERKMAEGELLAAKATAEQANAAKSAFLANMSHEIRTPMNAILGMTQLALRTNLDAKQRNYIDKAHLSAEMLLRILNDILDLSKIEADMLDMEERDFLLDDVMSSLADAVGLRAEEKGLELIFDIDVDTPTAFIGDSLRLGQILSNLGTNAVKFTEAGEIVVKVAVRESTASNVLLHFSVKDTGIGISREDQERLFESFFQVDASITREYGGTGLGLAIAKKLTERMGGEIWVESEPGTGSTFHFTVDLRKRQDRSLNILRQAEHLGAIKVLVVDDNATSREILSEMLIRFGFQTSQAESGERAITLMEQEGADALYDIVLMDWQMPGMNGVDTIRAIRGNPCIATPPAIIMVTAYGREEVKHAARNVTLAGILIKPVTPSTLLDSILTALGHRAFGKHAVSKREEASVKAAAPLHGAKVLVVEDNEINMELIQELLSSNGIAYEAAQNGMDALAWLEKEKFDAVLMDCQMPVMDGYTATRRIREQERFRDLPVLAMTANAMSGDREKVLEAGMNDHIPKPVKPDDMFRILARWIIPRRLMTSRGEPESTAELPELPGICIADGLASTRNNHQLYRRMLIKFLEGFQGFEGQFRAAQSDSDASAATRLAHTLKGVAGTLGVGGVQKAAAALEAACKGDGAGVEGLLAALMVELEPVLAGLRGLKPLP